MHSGGRSSPGRARAGRSSNARTQSYEIQPTAPPQNRGSPATSTGRISPRTPAPPPAPPPPGAGGGGGGGRGAPRGGGGARPPASTSYQVTLAVLLRQR